MLTCETHHTQHKQGFAAQPRVQGWSLMKCQGLLWVLLTGSAMGLLQGCSSLVPGAPQLASGQQTVWQPEDQLKWESVKIPGKVATQYSVVRKGNGNGNGNSLMANAQSSASMLRHDLHLDSERLNALSFSWQVQKLIEGADMALRDQDDSPVRVVLAFDGDRGQFSPKNAMLSELSHALSGRPMPYATLMYVWCNRRPVNSVITNPRTDRIRKIVIESGQQRLNQWVTYERNIRKDYEMAFGEPPGALIGIGIMTDSDNTRSQAQAWYGPIALK